MDIELDNAEAQTEVKPDPQLIELQSLQGALLIANFLSLVAMLVRWWLRSRYGTVIAPERPDILQIGSYFIMYGTALLRSWVIFKATTKLGIRFPGFWTFLGLPPLGIFILWWLDTRVKQRLKEIGAPQTS